MCKCKKNAGIDRAHGYTGRPGTGVAYAIDPDIVQTRKAHVGVETKDGLTLGMTVTDRRHHYVWEDLPIINIGCKADGGRFLKLLLDLVLC